MAVRKRVCVSKEVKGEYMDMCVGEVGISEGQLDLSGVSGTSESGCPGQGAPTATGTLRQGSSLVRRPCHLEGLSSGQECRHTNSQTGLGHYPEPKQ